MPLLLDLFLTFLKIGAVSFGGGYGMIPLLTEEVLAHGWLTESQLMNFIAVSESTPGPIAVNMATFIGASQGGILGAFLATLGVVLPAFIIILVVASIIRGLLQFAGVKAFLDGVRPVVVGLIIATAISIILTVLFSLETVFDVVVTFDWKALVIFLFVASVHFGYKKWRKKSISPIILILISALLGMLLYGLL
ncbi:MAG: chromate transporter [Clostridia bacterium]|nr:chromate transporter [Clostridia bacterium]